MIREFVLSFHLFELHMYIPTPSARRKIPAARVAEDKKATIISRLRDLSLVLYPVW
jgi:hypothetical protein